MRFAVRLTALGFFFAALLSVVGLRLWVLQVAEGPAIAQASEELTWLKKTSPAPRGDIFDRKGDPIATSRLVPAVVVDRTFVQPGEVAGLLQRLSVVLGLPVADLKAQYDAAGINGTFQVATVSLDTAYYISENLSDLPGVDVVTIPERVYLAGPTMAHVVGHLGLPEQSDLDARPDLDPSVRIGKLGVEKVYDQFLAGIPGSFEYRARRGQIIEERAPVSPQVGDSLVLTLDLELQSLVESAVEEGVDLSNSVKDQERAAGREVFNDTERAAAVVLDAQTFEVLALASFPDFDPQLFVTGIDQETFDGFTETKAFNNLAIAGLYPPASTFKAITYIAKEEENLPLADIEGVDVANDLVHCDGVFELPELEDGSRPTQNDWYYPQDKGWLDIHGALEQSCNIFFWSVGLGTWNEFKGSPQENVIQDWAFSVGYGHRTGIDLTAESSGTIPTRELFEQWAEEMRENPDRPPLLDPNRLELASPFFGGDLVNFVIGQGAFTATPLQVAVSYAVLLNGGTVMEPRVVKEIIDSNGELVQAIEPTVLGQVGISERVRQALLRDLNGVVTRGTASRAFSTFGPGLELVGGKTGTGQSSKTKDNHAWFVGVAPIDDPKYIVAVLLDEGGSGGRVAAPIGRAILQYLLGNPVTPIVEGAPAD